MSISVHNDGTQWHIDCPGGFTHPEFGGALRFGVAQIVNGECITCEASGEDLHKVSPCLQTK